MKRLIYIALLLFLFVSTHGQMIGRGPSARSLAPESCGTGTSNYGDTEATASYSTFAANYITYVPVTVTGCGGVISYHAFVGTTVSTHVKFALYTDASGTPGSYIENSITSEVSETASAWNTYTPVSTSFNVTAGNYWVASISDATHNISSTGGTLSRYRQSQTYANGFVTTASASLNISDCNINVYITVNHEF